jgi:hypothetical protein
VIGAAIMVAKIATDEIEDSGRDPGTESARKGGLKGEKRGRRREMEDIAKLIPEMPAAKRGSYRPRKFKLRQCLLSGRR